MFRVIQSWRARRAGRTARQNIAHDGERYYFETWAGGWVEHERAGLALAGVLRDAGLKVPEIRALLQQALDDLTDDKETE